MAKQCIGIDVGGTTAKIGLLSSEGVILDKWEIPTRREENGAHILPDIAASVREYLDRHGIGTEDILGAGIGVPGPVTPDGNVAVCVNLGWKQETNPEKELSRLLNGMYVKAGNDANVAALGEMWQGGGKGHKSIMLFTLGTGVGGGVVVNESVVAGFRGMGGEIGHILVNFDEPDSCNCGNHGCLEQYASATGIVRWPGRCWKLRTSRRFFGREMPLLAAKPFWMPQKQGMFWPFRPSAPVCVIWLWPCTISAISRTRRFLSSAAVCQRRDSFCWIS